MWSHFCCIWGGLITGGPLYIHAGGCLGGQLLSKQDFRAIRPLVFEELETDARSLMAAAGRLNQYILFL